MYMLIKNKNVLRVQTYKGMSMRNLTHIAMFSLLTDKFLKPNFPQESSAWGMPLVITVVVSSVL